jgi:hypothetical protein
MQTAGNSLNDENKQLFFANLAYCRCGIHCFASGFPGPRPIGA